MQGKRVYPDECGNMPLQPGDYAQLEGTWWVRPPRGGVSPVPDIPDIKVIEHEDGTISIEGLLELPKWTGYLMRGQWRDQPYAPPRSWRREGGPDSG